MHSLSANLPNFPLSLPQFKTVSDPAAPNHAAHPEEFAALDSWLREAYPQVWGRLEVEKASGLGGAALPCL